MKSPATLKKTLGEVRSLRAGGEYREALAVVDRLLATWNDQPALLVLRGELIQLQDEDGPPLSQAAEAFKRAAALDERNAEAWVELGHFQFAVDDDAKAAEKSFSRAIEESREALVAALLGRAAALEELGRKAEAFDCLSTARNLQHAAGANNGTAAEEASVFQQWESLTSNS